MDAAMSQILSARSYSAVSPGPKAKAGSSSPRETMILKRV
jgi:hypothetical protein